MSEVNLADVLGSQRAPEPMPDPVDVEQPAETPEAAAPEGQEPVQEQAVEPEKAPDPEPKPEAKPEKAEQSVPLAAMLAERDRARDLEARLKAMEAERQPKQPEKSPDVFDDPEAYTKHVQAQIRQATDNVRLDVSEQAARSQFGDEAVDAAFSAMAPNGQLADRAAYQTIMSERSPYHALVKWHQKTEAMKEIGEDPNAWKTAQREAIRREIEAEMATKQVRNTPAPPPSLADQTSVGNAAGAPTAKPSLRDIIGR
tara:strand:- start:25948 stop:26718 length:771 start_codon:yes stop_codon:yes gene_type:complete